MNRVLLYGISVIGPAHVRAKLPNQDAYLTKNFGSYALMVVSDGMGSKKHADIGAKATCKAVYKAIRNYVYTQRKHYTKDRNIFCMIKQEWLKLIKPHSPKDCCATCLFILMSKKKCFIAMLGDGLIYIRGNKSEHSTLMLDEKLEDFSNSTVSMCSTNYLNEWKVKTISSKKIQSMIITSDGISSDLQTKKEGQFADDLLKDILLEKSLFLKKKYLYNLVNEWSVPKHTDDKTIVVMEIL